MVKLIEFIMYIITSTRKKKNKGLMRCIQQYSLLIFVVPSEYLLWQEGFLPNPASSREPVLENLKNVLLFPSYLVSKTADLL